MRGKANKSVLALALAGTVIVTNAAGANSPEIHLLRRNGGQWGWLPDAAFQHAKHDRSGAWLQVPELEPDPDMQK
jgi:hypothetical protein